MDPKQTAVSDASQPPTVIFVTQPASHSLSTELPLKSFHFFLGIIQMVIGSLMFFLEIAAIVSGVPYAYGPGIYCGLLIFVSGLLSILGAKLKAKRPLIIACMILNIIASVMCFIGLNFASLEVTYFRAYYRRQNSYFIHRRDFYYIPVQTLNRPRTVHFGYGKSVFMVICCLLELVLTIVHASLSCRSICSCCMSNSTPAAGQQGIAYQTTYPAQASGYPPQRAGVAGMPSPYPLVPQPEPQSDTPEPSQEAPPFKYDRLVH